MRNTEKVITLQRVWRLSKDLTSFGRLVWLTRWCVKSKQTNKQRKRKQNNPPPFIHLNSFYSFEVGDDADVEKATLISHTDSLFHFLSFATDSPFSKCSASEPISQLVFGISGWVKITLSISVVKVTLRWSARSWPLTEPISLMCSVVINCCMRCTRVRLAGVTAWLWR